MGDEEGPGIPEIELIIRASTIDGRRKGACLFCQVGTGSQSCGTGTVGTVTFWLAEPGTVTC
jgi:hypothetical protein